MKHDQYEPWDSNTYRTGSTTPPKAHSRLVAILLVMVVLLSGLVSILSVLNIRLFSAFHAVAQPDDLSLSLEISSEPEHDLFPDDAVSVSGEKTIGIVGDMITPVYQKHFHLPQGLFITHVAAGSTAHEQGIEEGDVLISLGDVSMTDEDSLIMFLAESELGEEFPAVVYRRDMDKQLKFTLKIEKIEP